ncbi:MAG: DEAD/DEAH box helicase [Clostridiales bacterium GWB2_37_7]|nr:MAG: DEAD/DEAH box helicase [Clostridiales bacterium GWB2_37_7]
MAATNTKESGLEDMIVAHLVNESGYEQGTNADYDREHAIDAVRLIRFLKATQPEKVNLLGIESDVTKQIKFLHRLQGEITKNGIIEVLRKGIKYYPVDLVTFYSTPSPENLEAMRKFEQNIFSVTRQLRYSQDNTKLALDLVLFINGLPVLTCELKNSLTKQNTYDAIKQYKNDRDPRELLFGFGRCMVHFAVDDNEVAMCTKLEGKNSWFLPFNKGCNDGAGNPHNPLGLKTDYLWKDIFDKNELTDIIENYAQIIEEEEDGKKKKKQVFPRFHQLTVVKKLISDIRIKGAGKRYLIQHSAGSGKSNSIAWLAHQLVGVKKENRNVFDSIIVVTDRRNLDTQIKNTIKSFAQISSIVGHAEHSGDLKKFLRDGKRIIITTVFKFPLILDEIGDVHRKNTFAIIIDEAHSSQGGRTSAKMSMALSQDYAEFGKDEDETTEDKINKILEARKMLTNASYFAFTATPKNKTLETFGEKYMEGSETSFRPSHTYTMKQAIQENFIKDVLKYYPPISSFYKLAKTIEDDPMFDKKKAQKKLRHYVESHEHAIKHKAEIMIDHFHQQVINRQKIGGQARAMVVCSSIDRAIQYYYAICSYLKDRKSPYNAIIAFSGEHEYGGKKLNEAGINGFSSTEIPKKFKQEPYRFLVVADKFQTGFDEPLLHTMYVDKPLTDIKAVQTLSRLNRSHPKKDDTFVLDFINDVSDIQEAFSRYYKTTILSSETDPNKLNDLESDLHKYQIFTEYHVSSLVELFLKGAQRDTLDPILDICVDIYKTMLNEDEQVDFKSKAKAFVRTYSFLSAILPYGNAGWEKLSIFLNFLILKLPAPIEDDLAKGILETIDLDSYRAEMQSTMSIVLADQDAYIDPVPTSTMAHIAETEMEYLSSILSSFHEMFGNINWNDEDQVHKFILTIADGAAQDKAYQNARKNSDKQNAKIEADKAVDRNVTKLIDSNTNIFADAMEFYKQYNDNVSFRKWLNDMVFNMTYDKNISI